MLASLSLWLTISGPSWLRPRAMHISDRMFLRQTLFDNLLLDMLYEFFWLPLVEFKNDVIFITEALLSLFWDALVRGSIRTIVTVLDTVFPEPKYTRVRYGLDGKPKTGSRALRFFREERDWITKFFRIFPLQWNNPKDGYYWKYFVGYFWHQTIKRELFGFRWNPKRNAMVLVEMTAGIFLFWAVGWHFKALIALIWPVLPVWANVLAILALIVLEVLAVVFVRFLSWIEFFKYEIEYFYTSPWYQDGGKLNGRTLIVNLVWRAMNSVVFLAIAAYCPKAIDPRVYDIVTRAVWWLAPMILASTLTYFVLPVFHFLEKADDMNKKAVSWVLTIFVLIVLCLVGATVYRVAQLGIPENFTLPMPNIDWSFLRLCHENCSSTPKERFIWLAKFIGVIGVTCLVIYGLWRVVRKWAGDLSKYREQLEEDYERAAVYQWLWWIPSITVILFWFYFIPCYYNEVYLPDRLAREAAAAQQAPVPTQMVTVVPEFTLTPPAFTATPTFTFTSTPVNANTEIASPTITPTIVPTFTMTETPTPAPSNTPTATLSVGGTPDTTVPTDIPTIRMVRNCQMGQSTAVYWANFDPSRSLCADGSGRFNLVSGGFYYITLKVEVNGDNVTGIARFTLDGAVPDGTACTLNGEPFTTKNGSVTLNRIFRARLDCPSIGISAVSWSTK